MGISSFNKGNLDLNLILKIIILIISVIIIFYFLKYANIQIGDSISVLQTK